MRRETQEKFNQLMKNLAQSYGVSSMSENFAATTPMAQKLNDAIQASSAFLSRISIIPVEDIMAEVLDMQIHSTVAGRTDTSGAGERSPQLAGAPDGRKYVCKQTNFDVGVEYALLDAWARYNDFHKRYMSAVQKRIALDRILIGFYGKSAAATTDRSAHPKLEDVNTGWLFDLETSKPENFISEIVEASGKITLGSTGDYKNVDQLVYDVGSLIPEEHRTGSEVAIIGKGLVAHDMNKVLSTHAETPSEKVNFQILGKSYGGYTSAVVPQFPDFGVLITDPQNLQLYVQISSMRRHTENQPKKNRIVDFISQNEAYRIGNLNAAAAINHNNLQIVD
jgi:P2 family phage major capsid protein